MSAIPMAVGQRWGRWTVMRLGAEFGQVIAQCDCGNVRDVTPSNLRWGLTRSCGCLRRETCAQNLKTWRRRKLTPADVLAIRQSPEPTTAWSKRLGVSPQAVGDARRGKTYRNLPGVSP